MKSSALGWGIALAIFWFSTDPSVISIHPSTGIVNVHSHGVVNLCAQTTATTTCISLSI